MFWPFEFFVNSLASAHTHFIQLFKDNLIIQLVFYPPPLSLLFLHFRFRQTASPSTPFCLAQLALIVFLVFGSRLLLPAALTKCTQNCTAKVFPFPCKQQQQPRLPPLHPPLASSATQQGANFAWRSNGTLSQINFLISSFVVAHSSAVYQTSDPPSALSLPVCLKHPWQVFCELRAHLQSYPLHDGACKLIFTALFFLYFYSIQKFAEKKCSKTFCNQRSSHS